MAERIGLGAISTDEEIKEMAKPTSIEIMWRRLFRKI